MMAILLSNGMSSMKKTNLSIFGVLGCAVLLSACSGGSNNIADPVKEPTNSCSSDQDCVTGRLEDGQVAGIDYKCENITSVTGTSGNFTCPAGSTVKFFIQHPDSEFVVTLGETKIQKPLLNEDLLPLGPDGEPLKRIYITPLMLAGVTTTTAPAAAGARNITRLLHALNNEDITGLKDNPARAITLTPADKKALLVALGKSVTLTNMTDAAFESDFTSVLAGMTPARPLISTTEADGVLRKAVYGIAAGVYTSDSPLISHPTGVPAFNIFYGISSADEFFGETMLGVDRKGRLFGAGSASVGPRNETPELVRYDPTRFYVRPDLTTLSNAPELQLDGSLVGLSFDLDNSEVMTVQTGIIDRNFMAYNEAAYKIAYGEELPSDIATRLGTFQNATSPYTESGLNLQRPTNLVTTLNPDIWSALTFPMHITATLQLEGKPDLGVVNFTILSDGNIVSDLDKDCNAVDIDTLNETAGDRREFPVGVVERAFEIDGRYYLEPAIILPKAYGNSVANSVVGILISTIGEEHKVRLRVDTPLGSNYLKMYQNTNGVLTDTKLALWGNNYKVYKGIYEDPNSGGTLNGKFVTAPAACPP